MKHSAWIVILLCLDACLLFSALDLLPVWSDEAFTLNTVAQPVRAIIPILQHDIHPPLYFVLLHEWTRLPLPWTGISALRAFSAVWALASMVLFYLFWVGSRPDYRTGLILFALSPCFLLYARMARSYSMQVALGLLSIAMLDRWLADPPSWRFASASFAALLCLLYTHYVPGLAILAGFVFLAWRPLGPLRTTLFCLAIGAAYSPWIGTLRQALRHWGEAGGFASAYTLTGNPMLEQAVKAGFGVISLTIGESFPAWGLLLVPLLLWLAMKGARTAGFPRRIAVLLAVAALVGYFGVARWVSFPFIPGRMLWLLPFLCLAIALGISGVRQPWIRRGLFSAVLVLYLLSDLFYFRRENFANLGYVAPLPEIASLIRTRLQPADVILMDSYNTDFQSLELYLAGTAPIALEPGNAAESVRRARSAPVVWIVRNPRDISPGGLTSRVQKEACASRPEHVDLLEPYAGWQRFALRIAGYRSAPTHFYEVIACGKN